MTEKTLSDFLPNKKSNYSKKFSKNDNQKKLMKKM